jgi:DNA-binding SARP family transcriptional activator
MITGLVNALAAGEDAAQPRLHLLGSADLTHGGGNCSMAESSTRLLAFLALNGCEIVRRYVAERLWPDVDYARAAGNLRSSLWRLNALGMVLVESSKTSVRLCGNVTVDVRLLGDWAARMISGTPGPEDLIHGPWDLDRLELLPGRSDDWILLDRERFRQRILHALEILGERLIGAGRCAEAVEVALVAANADLLRESAARVLIAAHLAEGNRAEASRRYAEHRALVHAELGVEPSPQLAALFGPSRQRAAGATRGSTLPH